ncbi:MAG: NADH:flavin oxidoreductase/NADH oxidase [Gammaproteobacteria bacterium]|nr:NADH:flavin oxidoreductase/NADH oxidase [Gammaproteobacteria bacterium]
MSGDSRLFSAVSIGSLELRNRIMVSPMCQYSAAEGSAGDWHLAHLGSLAMSGAGLLFVEATAVNPEGRITPGCLGLYSEENEAALGRAAAVVRQVSDIPLGIQLAHAGRKASSRRPWEGGTLIDPGAGGWLPVAPSTIPQHPHEAPPQAMDAAGLDHVEDSFVAAVRRAKRLGFQAIELHMAHGYLLHQFLSPLANQRADEYGGELENRLRFPLRVFAAVQQAAGGDIPVGVRISATDWADGGWDIEQSVVFCKRLEDAGCQFVDVSSGGVSHLQKIPLGPGYQVPFAERIKREVDMPVISVGLITEPRQAEQIVASRQADMVALARGMLNDPRWPWRAAAELGATVTAPKQYWRCLPQGYPRVFGETPIGQR